MQSVLSQLNALPGVVGSLVCDLDGKLVCGAFPPVYDASALRDTARALAGGVTALDLSSHGAELLDFRYRDGRLLAKPFTGCVLALFCTRATNVQFVGLSLTAAVAKLEKLSRGAEVVAPPATPPPLPHAAPAAPSPAPAPQPAADAAPTAKGGKRVAPPASGLEELRRRLAQAGPATDADAAAPPPPGGPPSRR